MAGHYIHYVIGDWLIQEIVNRAMSSTEQSPLYTVEYIVQLINNYYMIDCKLYKLYFCFLIIFNNFTANMIAYVCTVQRC